MVGEPQEPVEPPLVIEQRRLGAGPSRTYRCQANCGEEAPTILGRIEEIRSCVGDSTARGSFRLPGFNTQCEKQRQETSRGEGSAQKKAEPNESPALHGENYD